MSELAQLAEVSRRLGLVPAYAQGGGGNTSVKTQAGMWIKASGVELAEAGAQKSFVRVDHAKVKAGLADARDEAGYVGLLRASVVEGAARPSIETGVHALLGRAVLHSHSMWINILACAREGEGLLRKILPGALWVPYATPGLAVTKRMAETYGGEDIIVLQNHGVIAVAETPVQAFARHEEANEKVRAHFGLADSYPLPRAPEFLGDAGHLLFPDQAVYLTPALAGSAAAQETGKAYDFLRESINKTGLSPHYLPAAEAAVLQDMEMEKYRQKAAMP